MPFKRIALCLGLIFSLGLLAACDSAEERAEGHYQNALALIEEGDVDRALVELRNVFDLNGTHRDARATYGRLEEERGNISAAYGQFLRLVEQYPDDIEGRRTLARLAITANNWEEAERHATAGAALIEDDPTIQAVLNALAYREALLDDDFATANEIAGTARGLIEAAPELLVSRRVVIDNLLREEQWTEALAEIEAAQEIEPEERLLHTLKLGTLEQLGREDDIETHLIKMTEIFPEDDDVHDTLVLWYLRRDRLDAAEDYLRTRLDPTGEEIDGYVRLVAFLIQRRGPDAAQAEITRMLDETPVDPDLFRSMRAELDFDAGNRDAAIAEMEAILESAEPSDQTNLIKVALAQMLIRTDNSVGARALVEEVLEADAGQVSALKLRAGWRIEDDQPSEAIVDLRQALDQAPRDPEIMTLMALAYERTGSRDLMGEMLALAVEASGAAPEESLRYAAFLLSEDSIRPAEDVLQTALRARRGNVELLAALGNLYIQEGDWGRAGDVIAALNAAGSETARAVATELTARQLAAQERSDELDTLLSDLVESEGGLQPIASVIRLRLARGDIEGALAYIEEQLAADPENPALRFIAATVQAVDGQDEAALATFRALLEEEPRRENVWIAIYNLERARGNFEAAQAVVQEALEVLPDSATLAWARAGDLEFQGDIDGAIEIYEALYARNSNSLVVANNLASLITTYRTDEESLQRAFAIARRLKGSEVPAFQDTYGWIAFRLGNFDEALEHLEPAAEGLPNDPRVQYHLARAYAAVERPDDARTQYERAVALLEDTGRDPELLAEVREGLTALDTPPAATGD